MFDSAQIERIVFLTFHADTSDEKRLLRARVKYLRKLNFPLVPKVGRGKPTIFMEEHLISLVLGLALQARAIAPFTAMKIANEFRSKLDDETGAYLCSFGSAEVQVFKFVPENLFATNDSIVILNLKLIFSRLAAAVETIMPTPTLVKSKAEEASDFKSMVEHVLKARDGDGI